jgi:hypothetical protein
LSGCAARFDTQGKASASRRGIRKERFFIGRLLRLG